MNENKNENGNKTPKKYLIVKTDTEKLVAMSEGKDVKEAFQCIDEDDFIEDESYEEYEVFRLTQLKTPTDYEIRNWEREKKKDEEF